MTIEEKIFKRKIFIPDLMIRYGFKENEEDYTFESDFMDGEFHAIINVKKDGSVIGTVIDKMNDEEYLQIRRESHAGSFVNSVIKEYEKLLSLVAEACCEDKFFSSDQANRITDSIKQKYNVEPSFPWKQKQYKSYGTFRHLDNGKWFAIIMDLKLSILDENKGKESVDIINLKVNPDYLKELVKIDGIYPGYHMNHKNWISITLDNKLSDEQIMELLSESFSLTQSKKK